LNCSFANPSWKTKGKNAATVVIVEASTGRAISSAPSFAACNLVFPNSVICLNILSTTTTELSTSIPIPKDNPIRDIKLILIPWIFNKKKVKIIDIGIATAIIKVAETLFKKIKSMTDARTSPCNPLDLTLDIEFSIVTEESNS